MYRNVFAIIVVYNPNIEDLNSLIGNLLNQTNKVIVCNNSSFDLNLQQNIKLFNFQENLGIAKAQSIGMKWAFNNDADFILQMDQDSVPAFNMVETLLHSYKSLVQSNYKVGLIAPQDFDVDTLLPNKFIFSEKSKTTCKNIYTVETAISSGSLIPKSTYDVTGEMNNELFIDLVDHEYCWRIKYSNLSIFKNIEAKLYHRLGEGIISVSPLLTFCICAPFRHYYVFRNSIYLIRKKFVPSSWKYKVILKLLITLIITPFIFDKRVERYKFMFKGILHGVTARLGKFE
jgi:rhamnosyltransferase